MMTDTAPPLPMNYVQRVGGWGVRFGRMYHATPETLLYFIVLGKKRS